MARVEAGPAIAQTDFSGGMVRSGDPAVMPANAFYDGQNALLDRLGGVFRRGGSSYRSTAKYGTGMRKLWDGWLANGQHTIVGVESVTGGTYGKLNEDGTLTSLVDLPIKPGLPASFKGVLYLPGGQTYDGTTVAAAAKVAPYYAVVGNRLVAAEGSRVSFSKINTPGTFEATDYWDLPGGVEILGLVGGRESAVIFTTNGIYVISNMTLELTDSAGNIQQRLDHYSGNLVLWGANGIASWEDALIVPSTDAVWLVKRGVTSEQIASFSQISQPIVDLYQEYVRAGYEPGQATVFRSHYILPIIGGGRVIDTLVCRLDLPIPDKAGGGYPWTRVEGFGAAMGAFETRVSASSSREPLLLGGTYGTESRVLNLSYFHQSEDTELDADGSVPAFSLSTRSYPTGANVANTVTSLRVRYQMSSQPTGGTLSASISSDTPPKSVSVWGRVSWGEFFWATGGTTESETLPGDAPESIDASKTKRWRFARKRRSIRFTLSCKAPTAQLSIKSIELFIRQTGLV